MSKEIDYNDPSYALCECGVAFKPFHFAGPPDRGIMDNCGACGALVKFTPNTLKSLTQIREDLEDKYGEPMNMTLINREGNT
mgnify:CR=1 FL=1